MPRSSGSGLKADDLAKYKKLLLARRDQILGSIGQMKDEALKTNDSGYSLDHLADYGSDHFEQEFTLGLIESSQDELSEINEALERIAARTFGTCEGCQKVIAKQRLNALPYARLCIECRRKDEQGVA